MKFLLAILALTIGSSVYANGNHNGHRHFRHHHWQHHHWHRGSWVAPAIVSGAVVYALTRPDTAIVNTPTVQIHNQPDQILIDGHLYQRQIIVVDGIHQTVYVKVN